MLNDKPQSTKSEPREKSCSQNRKNTRSQNQNRDWLMHLEIKWKRPKNKDRVKKSRRD
jgi:hypothetical protein